MHDIGACHLSYVIADLDLAASGFLNQLLSTVDRAPDISGESEDLISIGCIPSSACKIDVLLQYYVEVAPMRPFDHGAEQHPRHRRNTTFASLTARASGSIEDGVRAFLTSSGHELMIADRTAKMPTHRTAGSDRGSLIKGG